MLNRKAQVALTLRVVGGLTTEEIAKAFLTPTATVQQRIVRAKKALTASKAVFEVPGREEFSRRLSAVLGVLYLVFNEGYAASSGDEWMRAELSAEALRLARILAELVPRESEVHGLVALMELTARDSALGQPRPVSPSCWRTRTGRGGTVYRSRVGLRRWNELTPSGVDEARTACRRRLPNVMREQQLSMTPIGRK